MSLLRANGYGMLGHVYMGVELMMLYWFIHTV